METALLCARLFLAALFLIAGTSKVALPTRTRAMVIDFGVPQALAGPLSGVLPFVELVIGLALLTAAAAWWAAVAALVVLGVFSIAIAVNLARGRTPECNCFGKLESEPIGARTLVRNAAFMLVAAVIAWQGRRHPGAELTTLLGGTAPLPPLVVPLCLLLVLVVAWQSWFVVHLARQNGRLLLRMDRIEATMENPRAERLPEVGLPRGMKAPDFHLTDASGSGVGLADLLSPGKPAVLIFSAANCQPCIDLLPDIRRWHQDHKGQLTIVTISQGNSQERRSRQPAADMPIALQELEREVSAAYMAEGTPSAVMILPDSTLGSRLAMGGAAIAALVTEAVLASTVDTSLTMGSEAPVFELPDLEGRTVSLLQFRGRPVLLIFFDPGCGYCTAMVAAIKALPFNGNAHFATPLLVSAGSAEANREMVLRHSLECRLLLQGVSDVAGTYGANGTPMGYLLNERGQIASGLAAGSEALLALARLPQRPHAHEPQEQHQLSTT